MSFQFGSRGDGNGSNISGTVKTANLEEARPPNSIGEKEKQRTVELLRVHLPSQIFQFIAVQLDVFLRLQQTRYDSGTMTLEEKINVPVNTSMQALLGQSSPSPLEQQLQLQKEADARKQYDEWWQAYEEGIVFFPALRADATVFSLWDLTRYLMDLKTNFEGRAVPTAVGMQGGDEGERYILQPVEPVRLVLNDWYQHCFINETILQGDLNYAWSGFADNFHHHLDDDTRRSEGEILLRLMERLVYVGRAGEAARLLDVLYRMLCNREDGSPHLFTEVHELIALLKRLFIESNEQNTNEAAFETWRSVASDAVHEAKIKLKLPSDFEPHTVSDYLTQELFRVCLVLLIIFSGDDEALLQRCRAFHPEDGLGLTLYLVAHLNLIHPFAELGNVQKLLQAAMNYIRDNDGDEAVELKREKKWFYDVLEALFSVEILGDFVDVAEAVDTAAHTFPWSLEAWSDPKSSPHAGEDSIRHLLLKSLAAHLADLCAPPCVAETEDLLLYTHARNELVLSYTKLFRGAPKGWKVAALYAAYSPLLNPVELYNTVCYAGRVALTDRSTYHSLISFLSTSWNGSSVHQRWLYRHLTRHYPGVDTILRYFESMQFYYQKAVHDIHHYLIIECFNRGDVGRALWLALESGLTDAIQWELRVRLIARTALEDSLLQQVGQAVHHGFIAMDSCNSLELLCSLKLCAALSTYAYASQQVGTWIENYRATTTTVFHYPDALRAAAWCHSTVLELLSCMDQQLCFELHPSVTYQVIENSCDVLLHVRQWMTRHHQQQQQEQHRSRGGGGGIQACEEAWSKLASRSIPPLTQQFEITHLQHRKVAGLEETQVRAIREKLFRLSDSHF